MDLIWPRAETIELLKKHFGVATREDVFKRLSIDFRWIPVATRYPAFEKRVNGKLGGVAPGAGAEYIFHDERPFENHWGVVRQVGADGKYLEWKGGPLVGKQSLSGWHVPETIYPSVAQIKAGLRPFSDYVLVAEIEYPFKIAWQICSYEHFMTLMALNPEMVEAQRISATR